MFERAAWVRILPFLIYMLFIVLADLLERLGWSGQQLRWLYGVKIGAVLVALVAFWRHYTELPAVRLSPAVLLTAIVSGVLVLVLWVNLDAPWMVIGKAAGFDPRSAGQVDWLMVAVRIAGAALVVPVMEELFWRSFLMRWIEASDFEKVSPRQVKMKSLVVTVILFGIEHNLWFAGVVAGVVYSVLYMRHRTLWSPVIAHAVTNGLLGAWVVLTGSWTYW